MRALPAAPRRIALPPDSTRQGRAVLRLVALLEACGADLVAEMVSQRCASGEPVFAGYCWRIAAAFARLNGGRPRRQLARDAGRQCLAHDPSGLQCDVDPGTRGHQIRGQAHHARGRWWWT